jgi:hypothetical protein
MTLFAMNVQEHDEAADEDGQIVAPKEVARKRR